MSQIKVLAERALQRQKFQTVSNGVSNLETENSNILTPIGLESWKNTNEQARNPINHAVSNDSNGIGKTPEQEADFPAATSSGIPIVFPMATRRNIEAKYPAILTLPDDRRVKLSDVLDQAGTDDWPDLMNPDVMYAFASSLLMTSMEVWEYLP